MSIEEFNKYLKYEQQMTISSRIQYCGTIVRFMEYLKERNQNMTKENIITFISLYPNTPTRTKIHSVIKSYLLFIKSPILFELGRCKNE
jgi:hypothetical protein